MPRVACPKCSSVLKVRDESRLGRPGTCPKCRHRFVLEESPVTVQESPKERATPRKPKAVRRVATENSESTAESSQETASSISADQAPAATAAADAGAFPNIETGDAGGGTSRMRELALKRARQRNRGLIVLGAIGLCIAGVIWAGVTFLPSTPTRQTDQDKEPPQKNVAYLSERNRLEKMAGLIREDAPTDGGPISLEYVPAGASIVMHLHPARLWESGSAGEEVRYCLGKAFDSWLTESLKSYCVLPPAEIEEATICLILGARGTAPAVTAVVRPATPMKTSELIERFDGSPKTIDGVDVFVGSERAAVIGKERDDQKRPLLFATAPAGDAGGLAAAVSTPGIASEGVMQMLETTDRERDATIVFQPADLEIHQNALLGEKFGPLVGAFRGYFDENIEAAAWSLHFEAEEFVSELALRNAPATSSRASLKRFEGQLESLPVDLVGFVSELQPATLGERKLVGRLPAMMKLVDVSTVGGIDERVALLQTRLPKRAGPNLALASLLAWHGSTQDAGKRVSPGTAEPEEKKSLAERLNTPIEIDFRRTPLAGAFQYIGEETGVTFDIDGGALKLAGYTQNMPQQFTMGEVPAAQAIGKIVNNPDQKELAVVLDEANDKAIVTTEAAAEQQGLTPAEFPAP